MEKETPTTHNKNNLSLRRFPQFFTGLLYQLASLHVLIRCQLLIQPLLTPHYVRRLRKRDPTQLLELFSYGMRSDNCVQTKERMSGTVKICQVVHTDVGGVPAAVSMVLPTPPMPWLETRDLGAVSAVEWRPEESNKAFAKLCCANSLDLNLHWRRRKWYTYWTIGIDRLTKLVVWAPVIQTKL